MGTRREVGGWIQGMLERVSPHKHHQGGSTCASESSSIHHPPIHHWNAKLTQLTPNLILPWCLYSYSLVKNARASIPSIIIIDLNPFSHADGSALWNAYCIWTKKVRTCIFHTVNCIHVISIGIAFCSWVWNLHSYDTPLLAQGPGSTRPHGLGATNGLGVLCIDRHAEMPIHHPTVLTIELLAGRSRDFSAWVRMSWRVSKQLRHGASILWLHPFFWSGVRQVAWESFLCVAGLTWRVLGPETNRMPISEHWFVFNLSASPKKMQTRKGAKSYRMRHTQLLAPSWIY